VLPAAHRVTDAASFREATRRGRRASGATLVTHLLLPDVADEGLVRVGFVVSKAVGGSVVRNRVQRRLRHLVATRLPLFVDGAVLVVRALPAASSASSARLGRDLDRCLVRSGAVSSFEGLT
jgi:ribonuclease P protein component